MLVETVDDAPEEEAKTSGSTGLVAVEAAAVAGGWVNPG